METLPTPIPTNEPVNPSPSNSPKPKLGIIIFALIVIVGVGSYFFGGGNLFKGQLKLEDSASLNTCITGIPSADIESNKIYPLEIKEDCADKKFSFSTDDKTKAEILFTKIVATQDPKAQSAFTFTSDNNLEKPTLNWDFGDGSTSEGLNPEAHVYKDPGEKIITLTATAKVDGKEVKLKSTRKINIADSNLVLHYDFNGDKIENNEILDQVNQRSGKVIGKPSIVPGISGNAFLFDGKNDRIEVPSFTEIEQPQLSVSLWVKQVGTTGRIMVERHDGGAAAFSMRTLGHYKPSDQIGFLYRAGVSKWIDTDSGIKPDLNKWYHLVGTVETNVDKTKSINKIYVNGELKDTIEGDPVKIFGGGKLNNFHIAYGASSSWQFYNGAIDEVKLYNRVVSANEVTKLFNDGKAAAEKLNSAAPDAPVVPPVQVVPPTPAVQSSATPKPITYIPFVGDTAEGFKFTGTTTMDPVGKYFNGTSDYVESNSQIDLTKYNKLTQSFWLKINNFKGDAQIINEFSPDYNWNNGSFVISQTQNEGALLNAGKLSVGLHDSNNNYVAWVTDFVPKNGEWYHVTATMDRTAPVVAESVKLYINGKLDGKNALAWAKSFPGNFGKHKLFFGARGNLDGRNIPGYFGNINLAEFKMYGDLLTPEQIEAQYQTDSGLLDKLKATSAQTDKLVSDAAAAAVEAAKLPPKVITYIPFVGNTADGFKFNGTTALDPRGVAFNGSSDYVESTSEIDLRGYKQLTQSFWLKINDFKGVAQVINEFSPDYNYTSGNFIISQAQDEGAIKNGGKLIISMKHGSYVAWVTDFIPKNGEWYHVTATMDRQAPVKESVKLYINGELNGSNAIAWAADFPGTFGKHKLYIGARGSFKQTKIPGHFSNMNLAELRMYGGLMTPDQIKAQYDQDAPLLNELKSAKTAEEKAAAEKAASPDPSTTVVDPAAPAPAEPVTPDPATPAPAPDPSPSASESFFFASVFNPDSSKLEPLKDPITVQYGDAIAIVTHEVKKDEKGILHIEADGKRWDFDVKNAAAVVVDAKTEPAKVPVTAVETSSGGGGGGGSSGGGGIARNTKKIPKKIPAEIPAENPVQKVETKNEQISVEKILKNRQCLEEFTPPVFSDTDNEILKILAAIGASGEPIIKGVNKDGETVFNGDSDVQRAQWVKVSELIGCIPWSDTDISEVIEFEDISAKDWERTFVLAGRKLDIVNGYEDNTFRPTQSITRMESLKVLAKIAGIPPAPDSCDKPPVVDISEDHWGVQLFNDAYCNDIVTPEMSDGNAYFRPDDNLTRNEMLEFLNNYLKFAIR